MNSLSSVRCFSRNFLHAWIVGVVQHFGFCGLTLLLDLFWIFEFQLHWINTLRSRQNCRHFADGIFKHIFLNENVWISIKISLKLVPKGPIDNVLALVQIMTWHCPGNKPLSEPMMGYLTHTYMHHSVSMIKLLKYHLSGKKFEAAQLYIWDENHRLWSIALTSCMVANALHQLQKTKSVFLGHQASPFLRF